MKLFTALLALGLAAPSLQASEIDRVAAAIAGTEASFTQHFTPKGFTNSTAESGTVIFGTLPMMRWTYAKPEEKVFTFDGTQSAFYVAADKQVTVAAVDDRRKSELPFLLIGDPTARERLFMTREESRGNSTVITLQPRAASAMIRMVTLRVNPITHTIERLEYADREGNRTAFDFTAFHRHAAGPELFRFTPPPGVEVISAQ